MSAAKRLFVLPLILLALLLQGAAPAIAAVRTALDPFANLPICSTDRTGGQEDPAAPAHDQGGCQHCGACVAPMSALPPAETVLPSRFHAPEPRAPLAGNAAPRGPPRLTARARGPPLFA